VCTVVVSLQTAAPMPLLLLGFRDEFTGRPWQPPARHWPGSPLIGGRDEQAGGTWLAVNAGHPGHPRVSCILNARGQLAEPARRKSRGEIPLRVAEEGRQALRNLYKDPDTLAHYDPFYLVYADLSEALMLSWDGTGAALADLEPATHVLTNSGHAYPPATDPHSGPTDPNAGPTDPHSGPTDPNAGPNEPQVTDPKAARFGPKFAARRPSANPAATIKDAWENWLPLADGDGLPDTDPAAVIVRRELPDGRVWGTTSVTLVALGAKGLRYDFKPVPSDPATWYPVEI
jgi:hypothetical protein